MSKRWKNKTTEELLAAEATCYKCKATKSVTEFQLFRRFTVSGETYYRPDSWCKACRREYSKTWMASKAAQRKEV